MKKELKELLKRIEELEHKVKLLEFRQRYPSGYRITKRYRHDIRVVSFDVFYIHNEDLNVKSINVPSPLLFAHIEIEDGYLVVYSDSNTIYEILKKDEASGVFVSIPTEVYEILRDRTIEKDA